MASRGSQHLSFSCMWSWCARAAWSPCVRCVSGSSDGQVCDHPRQAECSLGNGVGSVHLRAGPGGTGADALPMARAGPGVAALLLGEEPWARRLFFSLRYPEGRPPLTVALCGIFRERVHRSTARAAGEAVFVGSTPCSPRQTFPFLSSPWESRERFHRNSVTGETVAQVTPAAGSPHTKARSLWAAGETRWASSHLPWRALACERAAASPRPHRTCGDETWVSTWQRKSVVVTVYALPKPQTWCLKELLLQGSPESGPAPNRGVHSPPPPPGERASHHGLCWGRVGLVLCPTRRLAAHTAGPRPAWRAGAGPTDPERGAFLSLQVGSPVAEEQGLELQAPPPACWVGNSCCFSFGANITQALRVLRFSS